MLDYSLPLNPKVALLGLLDDMVLKCKSASN